MDRPLFNGIACLSLDRFSHGPPAGRLKRPFGQVSTDDVMDEAAERDDGH